MWNDGGEKYPLTFEEFCVCFFAFVLVFFFFCLNLYFHLKLYVYVSKCGFVHVSAVPTEARSWRYKGSRAIPPGCWEPNSGPIYARVVCVPKF